MLTSKKMTEMLVLQDKMNSMVNPNWRDANYNWGRAIMVEAVEAIEHAGWKWWKRQDPDMPQLKMEIVDIWHFMLSMIMINLAIIKNPSVIADSIISVIKENTFQHFSTIQDALQSVVLSSAGGNLPLMQFVRSMEMCGMTWDDLYRSYIGKNMLNMFRQANGYKTGEYIKDWSALPLKCESLGRPLEDNDHLHEILQMLDSDTEDYAEQITRELEVRYAKLKK